MPKSNKIHNAILRERVEIIKDLIIDGHAYSKIKRMVKAIGVTSNLEKEPWNVSDRQIENYIAKATAEFRAEAVIDRTAEIGKFRNRYNKLYQRAFGEKDYRTAASIAEKEIKLLGLEAVPNMGGEKRNPIFGDIPNEVKATLIKAGPENG